MIEFFGANNFKKKIYTKNYIFNGIRVMKKYLFPSLENQSCKDFIWVLVLGDKANITYIKSLINIDFSFKTNIIYHKSLKNYLKIMTKGFDVLITTRIDYDDRIYYDAVNDVRKAININKPILIYGYNRGVYFYESDNKYYEFYKNYNNNGTMSIFCSLIIVLNKVNDTYNVYSIALHPVIRKNILEKYKSYGIKKLYYDPAIFDSGDAKFVWVRQNYSGTLDYSDRLKNKSKLYDFNLNNFYGK